MCPSAGSDRVVDLIEEETDPWAREPNIRSAAFVWLSASVRPPQDCVRHQSKPLPPLRVFFRVGSALRRNGTLISIPVTGQSPRLMSLLGRMRVHPWGEAGVHRQLDGGVWVRARSDI